MKFWQAFSFAETEQLLDLAEITEELGFEGVFLSDHLFIPRQRRTAYPYSPDGDPGFAAKTHWPDVWAAISAMAARTARLRFTTAVYILPLRHPLEVAKSVASAALLSGGRVALGAGAGWMRDEYATLGIPFESRGRRFDESIEVLRKLWTGEFVEHHGEFFDFGPLEICPAPPGATVPVYIGGVSPAALRRAGRLGDGWLGNGQTVDDAIATIETIAKERQAAGREHLPFEAIAPVTNPPEVDSLRRMEDAGATGAVSFPFKFSLGEHSTIDAKRDYLERYANDVIAKYH